MNVALDLDGVLADLHSSMIANTKYSEDDFCDWDKDDYDVFMSEAERVWAECDIPPVHDDHHESVERIASKHDVDIVTNTAGPDHVVAEWLDEHGIVYDDIVRAYDYGLEKPDLDYDVFIDDKPSMAGAVDHHYLFDRSWNQKERGLGTYFYHSYEPSYIESEGYPDSDRSNGPWVVRVQHLDHVADDLERIENL